MHSLQSQGQAIVERINHSLKGELSKVSPQKIKKKKKGFSLNLGRANLQAKNILTLMMRVLALLINTALSSPGEILFPLVRWRDSLFNFWQPPPPPLTRGQGYACMFAQKQTKPMWVLSSDIWPATGQEIIPDDYISYKN